MKGQPITTPYYQNQWGWEQISWFFIGDVHNSIINHANIAFVFKW